MGEFFTDINEIEHPLVLIKIVEKKYTKDTIENGKFFMNLASFYREKAKEDPKNLCYDIDEGSESRNITLQIVTEGKGHTIFDKNKGHCATNFNQCIYCTYGIWKLPEPKYYNELCDKLEKCEISKEFLITRVIDKSFIEGIVGSGNYDDYNILIFTNPTKTLEKIRNRMEEKKLAYSYGFVLYDDHIFEPVGQKNFRPTELQQYPEYYRFDTCFHKKKSYESQREYRIIAINNQHKPITDFEIGKLDEDEYVLLELEKNKDLAVEALFESFINYKGKIDFKMKELSYKLIEHKAASTND